MNNGYINSYIVATENNCFPAALEMVLVHFGIGGFNQKYIAKYFNIISNIDNLPETMWGAHVDDASLTHFISDNKINLIYEYIPSNYFYDEEFFSDFVVQKLSDGISLICGFNYSYLFGNYDHSFGHVSVITDIDSVRNQITILDPGPKDFGYKKVVVGDLFFAMKAYKSGVWCFKPK